MLLPLLLVTAAQPLTLDEAIDFASEHAATVIVARENVVLVDVEHMTALSAILPRLDMSASASTLITNSANGAGNVTQPGQPVVIGAGATNVSGQLSLGLSAQQLIFDGGRWWKVLARVSDVEASQRAALRSIENEVRALTTRAFYSLAKADYALKTIDQRVSLSEDQLGRAKTLLEVGRGTSRDVATAERNLTSDLIERENLLLNRQLAAQALNIQMGRPAETGVELEMTASVRSSTVAINVPARERLTKAALHHRPDLEQQRAEMEAATKDIDIAKADYWPTLAIQMSYQRNNPTASIFFGNPLEDYFAAASLRLQWNLFEGRATDARVQRARIELRKLVATLDDNVRRAISNVDEQLGQLEKQRRIHTLSKRGVRAAEEAVRLARGLFEAGRGTALELRDAEINLTAAQRTMVEARYDIEVAKEDLRRAVGIDLAEVP
ncbi:MAG: TolC family protein [Deltaproteobacteria bacterium]|jgi:outer membrane protein TolC